jgi:hypothetical protein
MPRSERRLSAVPAALRVALIAALTVQVAWQWHQPKPVATAAALAAPPSLPSLRVASLGEPMVLAQLTTLYLQAFDNQPGISIPFRNLDYVRVRQWLETIVALDPAAQYPLLLAAQVYAQVPDPVRIRVMMDFVHQQFLRDPNRRWRWLAHAAIMSKHRLRDHALALRFAGDITKYAPAAPNWARQMHIFILEDIGEIESAKILLGGLLASGEIRDPHELAFLLGRLESMKSVENPSSSTKN